MTTQTEWRKAIREREFKASQNIVRSQKIDNMHLKKTLFMQVTQTDNVLGQIRKEKAKMEDRLLRYSNEKAKIKSQQLLQQYNQQQEQAEENKQQTEVQINVEEISSSSDLSDEEENVFVSRMGHRQSHRHIYNNVAFELTNSEEDMFNQFMELKRQNSVEEQKGIVQKNTKVDEVNGLTLNKFLAKCRLRGKLDFAIERAETFVDEWSFQVTGEETKKSKKNKDLHHRNVNLDALQAEANKNGGLDSGLNALEGLEKDFKAILQEAKKARYLRCVNPEILERERVLTLDEIFQREATV